MTFIKITNGVVVQKQPYAEAGFVEAPDDVICGMLFDGEVFSPPAPETPLEIPLRLAQIACARLHVEEWDVTGIERSQGLSMAFLLDEQTAWIFFTEAQPDNAYVVTPSDGVTRFPDYLEVALNGRTDLALIVQRVQ